MKKFIVVLLVGFFLLIPIFLDKAGFFILNKPIPSNYLIIEAWLNTLALDNPPFDYNHYDTIFVVGVKDDEKWDAVETQRNEHNFSENRDKLRLLTNGYIFLGDYFRLKHSPKISEVKVVAQGSKAKGQYAHFILSAGDSMIAHSYVNQNIDTFTFKVNLNVEQLKYFNLYFDNDILTDKEDTNLNIYEIQIDSAHFRASENQLFKFQESLSSPASFTAKKLKIKENFKPHVIVVDTLYNKKNKTRAAAFAFKNYLKQKNITIYNLNIYTQHNHSRRTNLSYRNVLGPGISIGSIVTQKKLYKSFQNSNHSNYYIAVWDEIFSLLGTAIIN